MSGRVLNSTVAFLLTIVVCVAYTDGTALGQSSPSAAWKITLVAQPTNLALTAHGSGEPADRYVLVLTNTGGIASSGPITVTDDLPLGVTVGGTLSSLGWACPSSIGSDVVTCSYDASVASLGQSTVLTIPVAVALPAGASLPDVVSNTVLVSGGGAPAVRESISTEVGGSTPPFGFRGFTSQTSDLTGTPAVQASGHPYAMTTTVAFPQREEQNYPGKAVDIPKAMEIDLPDGLIGDPQVVTQCTIVEVSARSCPPSSRVGTFFINLAQGLFAGDSAFPVYNVVPERGYPAEFGFYAEGVEKPVFMYAGVRPGPSYNLYLTIPDVIAAAELSNVIVTFFGNPQGMDGAGNSLVPFFTNPSDCSGASLVTKINTNTWAEPGRTVYSEAPALPVVGCDLLRFEPSIAITPEIDTADEPSGYAFDVHVPQPQATGIEGLATPDLKSTTIRLPAGVSLSPAAADGLAACPAEGPEGINVTQAGSGHCPPASQIGTAEAVTPLLAEPLHGHVYVAESGCGEGPGQSPCTEADAANGTLYGLYLQLEGPGVTIKLHGTASANPANGQLTASFRESPQQPFSDLKLHFKAGPRAPLANPQTCGEAVAVADLTPWSSPETPDADSSSGFAVTGCEGSPFNPTFEAGSTPATAGAYTDVSATFSRTDRQQDLSAVQVQAPTGLAAMLSHVTLCEEPQAALGTCSSASQVGTATASSGSGSNPYWVSGPVYLTGPYKGAPFGLSVAIPAKAGPFDLGTIVRRATINIDPNTAAVTVTSDALPQIIDGTPLRVQTINITLNKAQFAFNPTDCEAKQMTATIDSAQGAVAHVSSPFAAGGCKDLAFTPKLAASSRAEVSKEKGAALDVKATFASGQANTHSVMLTFPKQLPARLTTIQQACPEATFAANPATCPAGSVIGITNVRTPVLSTALTGPVYLVSHGGAAFPDVDLVLQGEGLRVDVISSINIKKGITTTEIANAPDVPVSSFEVRLPEGPHSAFAANGSLCTKALTIPTTFVGQNGRRLAESPKVAVDGCPKTMKRKAKSAKKSTTKEHK